MPHDWSEEQIINRLRKEYPDDDLKVMTEFIQDHRDDDIPIDENVANYCKYRGCYLKDGVVAMENLK